MEFSIYRGITFTNLFVAAIAVSILFFVIWKRFELGLAILTVGDIFLRVIYFDLGFFSGRKGLLYPISFFVIILFGNYLLHRSNKLRTRMIRPQIIYLFVLFILVVLLTYMVNPRDEYSLGWRGLFYRLFPVAISFVSIVFLAFDRERLLKYLHYIFFLTASITVLYGITYVKTLLEGIPPVDLRIVPFFNLPLGSGAIYSAVCAIFCVVRVFRRQGIKKQWPYLLLLALSILIIFLSLTRIFFIAMFIVFLYLIGKVIFLGRGVATSFKMLAIIICLFIVFPTSPDKLAMGDLFSLALERLGDVFARPETAGGRRFDLYTEGWDRFTESPVVGVGAGNSGIVVEIPDELVRLDKRGSPSSSLYRMQMHSFYLEILYEQGVIGAIIMLAFFFHLMRIVVSNRKIDENFGDIHDVKIISNSVMILSLLSGITGNATMIFWASALSWLVYVWSRTMGGLFIRNEAEKNRM